jgi:long-chain acyl-CoA synthetase
MQINYYSIYFFKFLNDIKELKKTLFSSVSRLINCIYDKIRAGAKEKSGVQ